MMDMRGSRKSGATVVDITSVQPENWEGPRGQQGTCEPSMKKVFQQGIIDRGWKEIDPNLQKERRKRKCGSEGDLPPKPKKKSRSKPNVALKTNASTAKKQSKHKITARANKECTSCTVCGKTYATLGNLTRHKCRGSPKPTRIC